MEWQPIETAPQDGTKFAARNAAAKITNEWFRCYWGTYYEPDVKLEITDWLTDQWCDGSHMRLTFCRPDEWRPLTNPPEK